MGRADGTDQIADRAQFAACVTPFTCSPQAGLYGAGKQHADGVAMALTISRGGWAKIALSAALAALALVLTSFLDAAPTEDASRSPIAAEAAGGRPWCGPYDAFGMRSCRYWTFDDCLAAVGIGSAACRPNPGAVRIIDNGPYRTYRSLSRIGTGGSFTE